MTRCLLIKLLCALTLIFAPVIGVTVLAQETLNSWHAYRFMLKYTGNMYNKRERKKVDHGEGVYTSATDQAGLLFDCVDGNFRAGLTFKPQSVRKAFSVTRYKGTKYGHGLLQIDMRLDGGKRVSLGRWAYDKKEGSAKAVKRKGAARLYNAFAQGQKIEILLEGRSSIFLDLPKPNRAFANFGAACGLGVHADKK